MYTVSDVEQDAWVRRMMRGLIPALAILLFVLRFVLCPVVVEGISMEPTLREGDIIVVQRIATLPQRGDIIVCTPSQYGAKIVKRVIGAAGDVIDVDSNLNVLVNGERLGGTYFDQDNLWCELPIEVPGDSCFVLGDNRNNSYDSRHFGLIFVDEIFGICL